MCQDQPLYRDTFVMLTAEKAFNLFLGAREGER